MDWATTYQETCRELGVDEESLGLPVGGGRGMGAMVGRYTERVHGLLTTWYTNILEVRWGGDRSGSAEQQRHPDDTGRHVLRYVI